MLCWFDRRSLQVGTLFWSVLLCVVLLGRGPTAQACSLDGIASLSLNGVTATLTAGTPTTANLRYWAPFSMLAAAPGDTLHFTEDLHKVRASLSATMLESPFRWNFSDGTVVRGFAATHRFTQLGWHRFTVSYFWPATQRWIEFDSAQMQIVPAGDLLKTNFVYHLETILGTILLTALRLLVWGAAAVILCAIVLSRVQRDRRTRSPLQD